MRITQLESNDKPVASEKGSNFSFKPVLILANLGAPVTLTIQDNKSQCSRPIPSASGFSFYKLEESQQHDSKPKVNSAGLRDAGSASVRKMVDEIGLDNSEQEKAKVLQKVCSYLGLRVAD